MNKSKARRRAKLMAHYERFGQRVERSAREYSRNPAYAAEVKRRADAARDADPAYVARMVAHIRDVLRGR